MVARGRHPTGPLTDGPHENGRSVINGISNVTHMAVTHSGKPVDGKVQMTAAAVVQAPPIDGNMERGAPLGPPSGQYDPSHPPAAEQQGVNGTIAGAHVHVVNGSKMTEEELLAAAAEIRSVRALLSAAYGAPAVEPQQNMAHMDYVLREMKWLAWDMAQERLWKTVTARQVAYECAKAGKARLQRLAKQGPTAASTAGGQLDKALQEAFREEAAATVSTASDDPDFDAAAASAATAITAYPCSPELPAALEQVLMQQNEQRLIDHEILVREYNADLAAARQSIVRTVPESGHPVDVPPLPGTLATMPSSMTLFDDELAKRRRLPKVEPDIKRHASARRRSVFSEALQAEAMEIDEPMTTRERKRPRVEDDEEYVFEGTRPKSRRLRDMGRKPSEKSLPTMDRGHLKRRDHKSPMNRVDSNIAPTYGNMQLRSRAQGTPMGPGAQHLADWTRDEDLLLCAMVFEFGMNWMLISDMLSSAAVVQGSFRRADGCKYRFKQLGDPNLQNTDFTAESVFEYQNMTKEYARELMPKYLPCADGPLRRAVDATLAIGQHMLNRRSMDHQRSREADPNLPTGASVLEVERTLLQTAGGRYPSPTDIIAMIERQEAAAAAAQAQAAAAAAAAAAAQQQQQSAMPPPPARTPQQQQAPLPGPGPPQGPMQQQPQQQQGMPAQGATQMAGAMSGGLPPVAAHSPAAAPPAMLGAPSMQPQAAGQPVQPPNMSPAQARPRPTAVNQQQLTTILNTNRMPNGAQLTPEMREQLMQTISRRQQLQKASMQQNATAAAAMAGQHQGQGMGMGMPGQVTPSGAQPPGSLPPTGLASAASLSNAMSVSAALPASMAGPMAQGMQPLSTPLQQAPGMQAPGAPMMALAGMAGPGNPLFMQRPMGAAGSGALPMQPQQGMPSTMQFRPAHLTQQISQQLHNLAPQMALGTMPGSLQGLPGAAQGIRPGMPMSMSVAAAQQPQVAMLAAQSPAPAVSPGAPAGAPAQAATPPAAGSTMA